MKRKTFLTAILVFALLLGYSCSRDYILPDEMVGIWTTSSFQYVDTYFELKKNWIIFKAKTGEINVHPITKIEKQKIAKDEWVLYTIYYRNNEMQKVEFPFYYHTLGNRTILFKNQKNVVWRKAEG